MKTYFHLILNNETKFIEIDEKDSAEDIELIIQKEFDKIQSKYVKETIAHNNTKQRLTELEETLDYLVNKGENFESI